MATTSVRWTVTKALIDDIRAAPALVGVAVEPGWPGDRNIRPEMVWVADLDGDVSIPLMNAGRTNRDDRFTIPLEVRVGNQNNLDATMARLTEMVAAVEDVLAESSTLGDEDGVVSIEISSERMTCASTPEGHVGFAEVVVSVHSRLT